MKKIYMAILWVILIVSVGFSQTRVEIKLPTTGYAARLIGVAGTRTEADTVAGVYNRVRNKHIFDGIETSGLYKCYVDASGGTTWTEYTDWGGTTGVWLSYSDYGSGTGGSPYDPDDVSLALKIVGTDTSLQVKPSYQTSERANNSLTIKDSLAQTDGDWNDWTKGQIGDTLTTYGYGDIVVVSSDMHLRYKGFADYITDGTNDEVEIQAAVDSAKNVGEGNRTIRLIGEFNIDTDSVKVTGKVFINGSKATINCNRTTGYAFVFDESGYAESNLRIGGMSGAHLICDSTKAIKVIDCKAQMSFDNLLIYKPSVGIEFADVSYYNENMSLNYICMETVMKKGLYFTGSNTTRSSFQHLSLSNSGSKNVDLIYVATNADISYSHFGFVRFIPFSGDTARCFYSDGIQNYVVIDYWHSHKTPQAGGGNGAYSIYLDSNADGGLHINGGFLGQQIYDGSTTANVSMGLPMFIDEEGIYDDFGDGAYRGRKLKTRGSRYYGTNGHNLASIPTGADTTIYIGCPGASFGATISAGLAISAGGLSLVPYVHSKDSVAVIVTNPTAGAIDLDSTNFTVCAIKDRYDIKARLEWDCNTSGTITPTDSGIVIQNQRYIRTFTTFKEGYWKFKVQWPDSVPTSEKWQTRIMGEGSKSVWINYNYDGNILLQKNDGGWASVKNCGNQTIDTNVHTITVYRNSSSDWRIWFDDVLVGSVNDNICSGMVWTEMQIKNNSVTRLLLKEVYLYE